MVNLEFHDPSGTVEVTQSHASRVASLAGKRVGFVSNEQWQAHRMLPLLKSLLEADFPGIEVLPIDAFPQGNVEIDASKVVRESLALDPWPITASPDNFIVVVAGGGHPTNSYWLQGYSPGVVGHAIELPAAFDDLLVQADRDLGPR